MGGTPAPAKADKIKRDEQKDVQLNNAIKPEREENPSFFSGDNFH